MFQILYRIKQRLLSKSQVYINRLYPKLYAFHFQRNDVTLRITGPCVFKGEGKICIGKNVLIRSFRHNPVELFVDKSASMQLGDNVFINQGVRISSSKAIIIGNNTIIGDEVIIIDNDYHGVGESPAKCEAITIGSNVWIASRVIILKGVTVGNGSVIGAGAVVTHSVPEKSFAAGVPAKVIRKLDNIAHITDFTQ